MQVIPYLSAEPTSPSFAPPRAYDYELWLWLRRGPRFLQGCLLDNAQNGIQGSG